MNSLSLPTLAQDLQGFSDNSLCFGNSNKTLTNVDLTTKENVTRDSFQEHLKRFTIIVASSGSDTNKMTL